MHINLRLSEVKTIPRIERSIFPDARSDETFIEYLALDAVIGSLEKRGWNWKVCYHSQIGFDLEAFKKDKHFRIEVKGRSVGEYAGTVNESVEQKTNPRRRFHFSQRQSESGDFFICVFVGPQVRKCVVIPQDDFDKVKDTENASIVTLKLNPKNYDEVVGIKEWKDGRQMDITNYIEGWNLFEK